MAGTPLHPGLVHWPFAFLTLAYFLDFLQPIRPYLPTTLEAALPAALELQRISFYALSAGLATSVPAILTGASNAVSAVAQGGLYEKDGSLRRKVKVIAVHAALSDAVIAVSAWVWAGRSRWEAPLLGPEWGRAGVAVVLGLVLVFAAHMGGRLTYEFGMGMGGKRKSA